MVLTLNSNPIPEQQKEKRKELERKLEANLKEYEMLQISMQTTNDATAKITNMLSVFDTRLSKLEAYIMPIHSSTQVLTRRNKNLEKAIVLVTDYTTIVRNINYHENIVAKGVTESNLDTFLDSVNKLKDALHVLESSKYKSSERITQDLRGRLSKGVQELDDLFLKTLQASTDAVTEQAIAEVSISFGERLKQLQKLANALSDSLEQIGPVTGFLKIYSNNRSEFLIKCLAHHNVAAKDQEIKMGYTREVFQRGSSLLIPYALSMIIIFQAEHLCTLELISKNHVTNTFINTITAPVDLFLEACDALLNRVRRSIQRRELNDLYILVDIWGGLNNSFVNQDALFAHCGKKGHDIRTFMANVASTIISYLRDFYEECRMDSDAKRQMLSLDGTVHEMTSTTINAIKKLHEFSDILQTMLISNNSNNVFPATTIIEYINNLLDLLLIDLESKAKNYKKPVLACLLILNNSYYISKSIKGTALSDVVYPLFIENLGKGIKKQLEIYRSTWIPIIEHLMDNTKISEEGKIVQQLSKQQRDIIKEKFKCFNRDFEDLYITQKNYAIPDVELRHQVIKEVRMILCPMFNRFYDRYTTALEFTKNVDKYIKYNKEELSAQLDKFFDASS